MERKVGATELCGIALISGEESGNVRQDRQNKRNNRNSAESTGVAIAAVGLIEIIHV